MLSDFQVEREENCSCKQRRIFLAFIIKPCQSYCEIEWRLYANIRNPE